VQTSEDIEDVPDSRHAMPFDAVELIGIELVLAPVDGIHWVVSFWKLLGGASF
jgi:hypothetical protein